MALMGAALLPLAILSYVQALTAEGFAESRAKAAILGETIFAASPQIDLLVEATGAVKTLAATLPQVVADPDACKSFVRRTAAAAEGRYSFVGFIPPGGMIDCTTADASFDLSDSPWLVGMNANPEFTLTVNRHGPISGTSILNLSSPVTGPDGRLMGFASLSMTHSAIDAQIRTGRLGVNVPSALITFDADGEVLTSSVGMDDYTAVLPESIALGSFVGQAEQSFIATATSGERRAFAVVPISPGKLYILGSWPVERLAGDGITTQFSAITFPLLMWAASLLVAWIAAESQVLRHVRDLRDSITDFAKGERKIKPLNNQAAAAELREAGEAFLSMTDAIVHDEAQLENTIHQKEVLLREVHHRVKNNLQLIASILNMQLRTAKSDETLTAMKSVQERVISLATIHRELYQTSGLTDIRADELLPRLAGQISKLGSSPERRVSLDLTVDDIRLTPDQSVPLSLFMTEALTNSVKHAWQDGSGKTKVTLTFLRRDDGAVALEVRNRVAPQPAGGTIAPLSGPEERGQFGSKLLDAFARQLDGKMQSHAVGADYVVTLVFHPAPLAQAEERMREADHL